MFVEVRLQPKAEEIPGGIKGLQFPTEAPRKVSQKKWDMEGPAPPLTWHPHPRQEQTRAQEWSLVVSLLNDSFIKNRNTFVAWKDIKRDSET
jgi:hypothetical protein